jgi:hypothetical protein
MHCRFKNNFLFIRLALVTVLAHTRTDQVLPHDTLEVVIKLLTKRDRYCPSLLLQMVVEGLHRKCDGTFMWKSGNKEEGSV